MKTVHCVQISLMILASAAASFGQQCPQYAHITLPITAAAVSVLGALGLVSPGVLTNGPPTVTVLPEVKP
jgi:hypothetical protein